MQYCSSLIKSDDYWVLNLSVPYLFLFRICSEKYNTALHSLFNIVERARKRNYLTQWCAAIIQYIYTDEFELTCKDSTALNRFCVYKIWNKSRTSNFWNIFKNYQLLLGWQWDSPPLPLLDACCDLQELQWWGRDTGPNNITTNEKFTQI